MIDSIRCTQIFDWEVAVYRENELFPGPGANCDGKWSDQTNQNQTSYKSLITGSLQRRNFAKAHHLYMRPELDNLKLIQKLS
jgi:hypothetical protein